MLVRLRQLHVEMFEALAESEALAQGQVPGREMLARVRWNLTRAGKNLRRFNEDEVYPSLLALLSTEKAETVRQLGREGRALRVLAAEHIEAWPIGRVACEWDGYGRASASLRGDIRRHVAAEQAMLYPLLALIGEPDFAALSVA